MAKAKIRFGDRQFLIGGVPMTASAADLNRTTPGNRAVVPTADGLTTGLILSTDVVVEATSANSAHLLTLPAIADVPLGWQVKIFLGATAARSGNGCDLEHQDQQR